MSDEQFMKRALDLALIGAGSVSPNPLVGCVIVHEGKIIGEGYHQNYGESHAEVNAVNSVKNRALLSESTVYVTLEPCAHFGVTPPCADLLIKERVSKVIICNQDPNPKVSGRGIVKIREAGIDVSIGLLQEEGLFLNRRFFTSFNRARPYVILKWAQTADGFIARKNFDSKWISNQYSRQLVHQWRGEEDSILVGTNTARHDNPSLTVRDWSGSNPIRVIIDSGLNLDENLHLFDKSTPTLCLTHQSKKDEKNLKFIQVDPINPQSILDALHRESIRSVIIEGGTKVLHSFISDLLWDEARVFTSPVHFGEGIKAPYISGKLLLSEDIHGDQLTTYQNTHGRNT